MRTESQIAELLSQLDQMTADALETQDLDFKEWPERSINDGVNLVIEMAICLANGGGGDLVIGVRDYLVGRHKAILGVPELIDVARLQKAVYDRTDPKLTARFMEMLVCEGTGRLIIMSVTATFPYATDTAGGGKIRIGKECQPLTGTMRQQLATEQALADFTIECVKGDPVTLISSAAMEKLRDVATIERAPDDLMRMTDLDLLGSIGAIRGGKLTRAGLLLAGKEASIREHLSHYIVSHFRMKSDVSYTDQSHGSEAIPIALNRITDRIMADNPITTIQLPLFHLEYRTYPELALREALANAFCHADYRVASPILVKQYAGKLEISNPGNFIGGITPDNILHHPPTARNPHLVDAMTRLRLVNRANLGISRMYQSLLIEGKEPPLIGTRGAAIVFTLLNGAFSASFRTWVAKEEKEQRNLNVDDLLVVQYLLRHPEIDAMTAAHICQRSEDEAREVLSELAHRREYLDRGGTGRGTYYVLNPMLYRELAGPGNPDRFGRIEWEAAKTRILSVLRQRANRGQEGLTNLEVRGMTQYGREQAKRLLRQLHKEQPIRLTGRGRYARWEYMEDVQ